MKKEKIFNLIKIILPIIIFSVGFVYLLAWDGPNGSAPNSNTSKPINIGSNYQIKGNGVWNGSLFDIKGFLSIDNHVLVQGDADFAAGLTLYGLTSQGGEETLCAATDGTIVYCDPPPPIPSPTVSTTAASGVGMTYATSGGNVTLEGGAPVTIRGVVWSMSPNPTVSLPTKTLDGAGLGSYVSNITGLSSNTTYHVRAYATNAGGTNYGNDLTFSTPSQMYTLSVVSPGANGLIQSTPSNTLIRCGQSYTDCSESLAPNTVVSLTVTPASGYSVSSWAGCTSSSGNTCSVTMTGNKTVSVTLFTCPASAFSYNGHCWYKTTTQQNGSYTCNTYCSSMGKTCVNSTQTCAQDKDVVSHFISCSNYQYDTSYNSNSPQYNGGDCGVRTNQNYSCGTGNVPTNTCALGARQYWYAICSCI